ncbi:hypothetical protein CTER_3719 [Ruminiclostridium cellobioparum subsp. termitidis CT1112]|uniref:Uncharacterized protein n=1 Tax=Ruminiclostridium cellobioparum subsp. termitidis CT1112 TaxID=1195236 RepID=S0FH10_RUMCE|nr:hypothetical protein CTER_3719 [Ruminiclostridium cellobioparum subsp. termitidis CT1112]
MLIYTSIADKITYLFSGTKKSYASFLDYRKSYASMDNKI